MFLPRAAGFALSPFGVPRKLPSWWQPWTSERFGGRLPCPVLRGSLLYIQHPTGRPHPSSDTGRGGGRGPEKQTFHGSNQPHRSGLLGAVKVPHPFVTNAISKKIDM